MKRIIYIFLVLSCLLTFNGCRHNKYADRTQSTSSNIMFSSSDFNKENYIWENFTFPTNRTSGLQ